MLNLSLNHKSRMKREFHVRFCERWGGKFPLPTRHIYHLDDRSIFIKEILDIAMDNDNE